MQLLLSTLLTLTLAAPSPADPITTITFDHSTCHVAKTASYFSYTDLKTPVVFQNSLDIAVDLCWSSYYGELETTETPKYTIQAGGIFELSGNIPGDVWVFAEASLDYCKGTQITNPISFKISGRYDLAALTEFCEYAPVVETLLPFVGCWNKNTVPAFVGGGDVAVFGYVISNDLNFNVDICWSVADGRLHYRKTAKKGSKVLVAGRVGSIWSFRKVDATGRCRGELVSTPVAFKNGGLKRLSAISNQCPFNTLSTI